MSTPSQRLRSVLSLAETRLRSLVHEVWSHPGLNRLYPEFLFANYGLTLASAPAMRLAAQCCLALEARDPLRDWLRRYFLEHAREEQDHANWILADLNSLGIASHRTHQRLPYPSVAAAVGSQYYWMQHIHPIAYLGFIAVVEAPADLNFLRNISQRTGIPLSSMSCHYRHAELDPEHIAEFDAALDSLPLTPFLRDLISVSAITTIGHLERVFSDILEHFQRVNDPTARVSIFTADETLLDSSP